RETNGDAHVAVSSPEVRFSANRRLLLVDDEDMMRSIARYALTSEGYECEEAVDGRQAIEMARAKPYDLILVDVELPGVRGDDVLRRLRDEPPVPNLKIIMASGRV